MFFLSHFLSVSLCSTLSVHLPPTFSFLLAFSYLLYIRPPDLWPHPFTLFRSFILPFQFFLNHSFIHLFILCHSSSFTFLHVNCLTSCHCSSLRPSLPFFYPCRFLTPYAYYVLLNSSFFCRTLSCCFRWVPETPEHQTWQPATNSRLFFKTRHCKRRKEISFNSMQQLVRFPKISITSSGSTFCLTTLSHCEDDWRRFF